MSVLDKQLMFCDSTSAATGSNASAWIGDIVDLGIGRDFYNTEKKINPGFGEPIYINIICEDEDFVKSGEATTCVLEVIHASGNSGTALTTNAATLITTTLTIDSCDDGVVLLAQTLPAGATYRYLQLKLTCTTAAITAGKMTGWLSNVPLMTPEALK